ncbi:periplasmic heavy metal sensor [Brevundimonas subvibrioides]|uniref:periplasmic heavy metal sensor n=1 Tax=Brevundimonas subvibrioides TaxID=74313 RepID=UPI0022B46E0A|nr:periplasmic heavy metal sensor [Brevundimonas subvibrioides]
MKTRTLTIVLGAALAISVGVNLFAATAAYSVLLRQDSGEHHRGDADGTGRPSSREMIDRLSPEAREPVRQALRVAARRARPDFQASREARRQAIGAASAEPMDAARVAALLDQSRAAEVRGRESLEVDAVAILQTLKPADRAVLAQMLNARGRGGGHDRRDFPAPRPNTPSV